MASQRIKLVDPTWLIQIYYEKRIERKREEKSSTPSSLYGEEDGWLDVLQKQIDGYQDILRLLEARDFETLERIFLHELKEARDRVSRIPEGQAGRPVSILHKIAAAEYEHFIKLIQLEYEINLQKAQDKMQGSLSRKAKAMGA